VSKIEIYILELRKIKAISRFINPFKEKYKAYILQTDNDTVLEFTISPTDEGALEQGVIAARFAASDVHGGEVLLIVHEESSCDAVNRVDFHHAVRGVAENGGRALHVERSTGPGSATLAAESNTGDGAIDNGFQYLDVNVARVCGRRIGVIAGHSRRDHDLIAIGPDNQHKIVHHRFTKSDTRVAKGGGCRDLQNKFVRICFWGCDTNSYAEILIIVLLEADSA